MTCETCGEKPKKCGNCNKDFPRAVIEINNPETLVLLRKVVIPASMGDEEQVPPAIGKYHNVILYYEANDHIYLYSSDGIPTAITADIPQEVLDSIEELEDGVVDLQEQIDDLKNSPDVVDIVATYADLQSYDTSRLGDNDVIRVLADETHDGESSYYRWSATTQTWTFIGATGPYYTKSETDTLIGAAKGSAKELTSDDYNWPTDNPDGIAVWTLDPGFYRAPRGIKLYWTSSSQGINIAPYEFIVAAQGNSGDKSINLLPDVLYHVRSNGFEILHTTLLKMSQVVNNLNDTSSSLPLSANQGKVLKDTIGNLSDLTTTDKSDLVAAINEAASGGGPTVVQTTGTSTTDVMSQNATTNMIYNDPAIKRKIAIGGGTTVSSSSSDYCISIGQNSVARSNGCISLGVNTSTRKTGDIAIGYAAKTSPTNNYGDVISIGAGAGDENFSSTDYSISIGNNCAARCQNSVVIGRSAYAQSQALNSVAIGYGANTTVKGQFDIGTGASNGYSDSAYRLLTGLYDPQSAHDAATKGYVDTAVAGVSTNTISSQDWSALWQ